MLVIDDVGNHHVADAAVEGSGLAQNIYAQRSSDGRADLAKHMICSHAQGIVDIEKDGVALTQQIPFGVAHGPQAWVDVCTVDAVEFDDLRLDVQTVRIADTRNASLAFTLFDRASQLSSIVRVINMQARRIVKKVVKMAIVDGRQRLVYSERRSSGFSCSTYSTMSSLSSAATPVIRLTMLWILLLTK